MKNVVIVESPAKANTISKYLGSDFVVLASYGHIRDLPSKDGSVNPDDDFSMKWEIDARAKKRIDEITKAVKKCETVLLATDPDREGEAISWHVYEVLKEGKAINNQTVKRVVFNEITKRAVVEAVENPRQINMGLVDAYMARRALDYLVGFSLSPVLWRKLPGSRSAGRVQSVALRLICEREAEIEIFKPQEYWSVESILQASGKVSFSTNLVELNGKKIERLTLQNEQQATEAVTKIRSSQFAVKSIDRKEVKRNPYPPFITSTLQQEASRKLGFSATKTMQIAQKLYEGIQLEGETVGLITYMRTDGVNMAQEAVASMRDYIGTEFGANYLPEAPRVYKSKTANAQEAHEAIRPTDITRTLDSVKDYLDYDQQRLYELIWKRALSCQMANAVFDQMTVEIASSDKSVILRATGSVMLFDGFMKIYQEDKDEKTEGDEADHKLPKMSEGETLNCLDVIPEQHFTKPPPRFTEAGLIKKLEELGIGRPSTYASIIRILQDRNYVRMDGKRFIPEDRGILVTTFLSNFFDKYIQYGFTADLEDKLDDICHEKITSKAVLGNFWKDFKEAIALTKDLSITSVLDKLNEVLEDHFFPKTDENHDPRKCPLCSSGVIGLKLGKYGAFIGCSNYPDCRYTRQLKVNESEVSLDSFAASPVELGEDPVTSKKVFVCKGPYGFYVQLGEEEIPEPKKEKETQALQEKSEKDDKKAKKKKTKKETKPKVVKPKRTSIPQSMNPTEVTLENALSLLSLPRELGIYPETGEMISTSIGRFGPYLKFGSTFVSLKAEDDVLTVGLERAIELITASGKKRIELGEYKKKPVAVQKGRFGFFVVYNKLRVAIPKTKEAESLTLDEAIELIDKKLVKGQKDKEETDKEEKPKATKTTKAKASTTKSKSANVEAKPEEKSKPKRVVKRIA
ncbi:MAG: type I DNA topoisomerase [Candidatus Caenarcaniphilales bacterium]|nr:type I DNA topoisomerase [Candidatus Caenarcaniphilales bacterium]